PRASSGSSCSPSGPTRARQILRRVFADSRNGSGASRSAPRCWRRSSTTPGPFTEMASDLIVVDIVRRMGLPRREVVIELLNTGLAALRVRYAQRPQKYTDFELAAEWLRERLRELP